MKHPPPGNVPALVLFEYRLMISAFRSLKSFLVGPAPCFSITTELNTLTGSLCN